MNNSLPIILLALLGLLLAARAEAASKPVTTVKSVDLNRYLGIWYQQAFFPTSFQKADCGKLVTAEYSFDKKGKIRVQNTCYADAAGKLVKKQATAKAWSVDPSNSKLKVMFFWPFKGDYWIVKLDEKNYSYSVVSDPKREYLWILTREKAFDKATYDGIVDWLKSNGWNTSRLVFTGSFK